MCLTPRPGPFHPVGFDAAAQTQEVIRTHDGFHKAVTAGRLFLPRGVALKVDNLEVKFIQLVNRFNLIANPPNGHPNTNEWMKLAQEFHSDMQAIVDDVTEDMRTALGDTPAAGR